MTDFHVAAGKVEVYQGADEGWYWRLTASNGEQLAQGESHTRRADAERAARRALLGPEPPQEGDVGG